jgi:hypothetical protein
MVVVRGTNAAVSYGRYSSSSSSNDDVIETSEAELATNETVAPTMTRDGWWDAVMSAEVVTITFAALSQILSLFSSNFLFGDCNFLHVPVEGTSSFYTRVKKWISILSASNYDHIDT